MKNLKLLIILLLLLLMSTNAFAVPPTIDGIVVTGNDIDGFTITATGTDLNKLTPGPLQWITSEGQTPGSDFAPSDWTFEEPNRWFYSDAQSYSGSMCLFTNIQYVPDGAHAYYDNVTELEKVLFIADVLFETTVTSTDWAFDQIKFMGIRSDPWPYSGGDGAGYIYDPWFDITNQVVNNQQAPMIIVYDGVPGLQSGSTSFVNIAPDIEQWHSFKYYGERASAPNTPDGTWISQIFQAGTVAQTPHNDVGNRITHGTIDPVFRYVGFRNEITNGSGGQNINIYIDNIYIDNTQACIIIGDNPILNLCQLQVIQPTLTTRGPTGFVVDKANKGKFINGVPYHIYAKNAAGEVSNSFPIVFTESAATGTITMVNSGLTTVVNSGLTTQQ